MDAETRTKILRQYGRDRIIIVLLDAAKKSFPVRDLVDI